MSQKKSKPEFYADFMNAGFFPEANKITKYQESQNYWIFKTGKLIYKVKKKEMADSTVSLDEIFCNTIVQQVQRHSPELNPKIATIKKQNDSYILDQEGTLSLPVLNYVIVMAQLPDRGFLNNILKKKKLNEKTIDLMCSYFSDIHNNAKIAESKEDGTPDNLVSQLQNLYYQSKKHMGVTMSQAIIDMTSRPLEKYLSDNRKLFLRRIRKEHIRQVHGCLIPRKIHINKDSIQLLGITSDPMKDRFKDVSSDISDLSIELELAGQQEAAEYLIQAYCKLTHDKELKQVLPVYQAMKCLSSGLEHSINLNLLKKSEAEKEQKLAVKYYEQTVEVIRKL